MNKTCLAAVGAVLLVVAFSRLRPSPPCPPAEQPAPQPLPRIVEAPAPAPAPTMTPVAPPKPPPTLYQLRDDEITYPITANADRILREHYMESVGNGYRFFVGEKLYLGRLEWTYNEPGGAKRPWGYNVGVRVYRFEFQ